MPIIVITKPVVNDSRQQGFTLMEVLVSIVVLALGALGVLDAQMRTLADTQTSVRREQAIRLIENLSESIRANPNALTVQSSYVMDWGAAAAPGVCADDAPGCAPADLASHQMQFWKQSVANDLPGGDAKTFLVSASASNMQLGVMISWRANERSAASDYTKFFDSTATTGSQACDPGKPNRICHLQFISLTARCPVDALDGAPAARAWFCPDGIAGLPN